jgi:hypothetical protein
VLLYLPATPIAKCCISPATKSDRRYLLNFQVDLDRSSQMTRPKKQPVASKAAATLLSCTLCDKSFRLETKLQRHLLEQHVAGVSIAAERPHASEGQRRAHDGVKQALSVANVTMAKCSDPAGAVCPQCVPDAKGKKFKTPVDMACHILSKHCEGLSDDDEEDGKESSAADGCDGLRAERSGRCRETVAQSERSERVSMTRKRSASAVDVPADDVAKRTKLLCVDVSRQNAVAPPSETLPNPPKPAKPPAKIEPAVVDASAACVEGPKSKSNLKRAAERVATQEGSDPKKRRLGAAEKTGLRLTFPALAEKILPASESHVRPSGRPANGETKPLPVTANRPPPTPKPGGSRTDAGGGKSPELSQAGVGNHISKKAGDSRVPSVSCGTSAAMAAAATAAVVATAPQPASLIPLSTPLGGLSTRIVPRGFDMDFGDIGDFPSSVERAYYRSSRKVETGGELR